MHETNDWRLTNQDRYLKGATVKWVEYKTPRPDWDHDHCAFCWDKFMEKQLAPGILREGYVTVDEKHWICKQCFEDFKDDFEFKVA